MNNHRLKEVRKYLELRGIDLNTPFGKRAYKKLKEVIKSKDFNKALKETEKLMQLMMICL